jgi:hypothetical protein
MIVIGYNDNDSDYGGTMGNVMMINVCALRYRYRYRYYNKSMEQLILWS